MKKLYLLTLLSLLLCFSCTKKAETDPEVIAMRGLVNRVVPEYSQNIVLKRLENDTVDRFEIEMKKNKLVIRGNNANSMAVGLNHYLKYYCMHNTHGSKRSLCRFLLQCLQYPRRSV